MNRFITTHPIQTMGSYNDQQLGWSLSDIGISDPWEEFRTGVLEPLADSAGLSKDEMDAIANEAEKAKKEALAKEAANLFQQITGTTPKPTNTQSTITNLQNQISNLTKQLSASVPGGMTTLYAVGGLLGGFVVYKLVAGPKD